MRFAAALAAGFLVTHAAVAKDPALLSLGAEHFTSTASVVEGAQETTISTEPGYVERSGLMGEVWHDEFLKGVIERDSGHRAFQLDVLTTYRGARRSYKGARYPGLSGSGLAPVTVLKTLSVNCPTGECTYTDELAIPVEEAVLRQVAQGYVAGRPALWTFQVIAKGAAEYQGSLSNAEVAGFLARVDTYVEHPQPAPPLPAAAPARLEFGISGLAVAAAPDMPNRAGVLVVGVTPGSIAQKAGIITGDIIYQFNTRSIRTLPDLEAAVVASSAHTVTPIRLFRGTEPTTLEARF
jgi:PDZ domain